ncbi:enoyl-CoA hydratase/isomerase family protein [Novosphingopyxis sp.]|uniref:enoyl-CoA hydratase/isomerase family protein n=1 Tax=Novosphingopyxis sp. TaxID=2709690 RepID=UPI003B5B3921
MQWVTYEVDDDGIAVISMNRPERLNAWGSEMASDLSEAFERYNGDRSARVAILRGEGRAFCVGADAKEYTERQGSWSSQPREEMGIFGQGKLFKPVIGAIQGHCLGAGLILLAVRCDIRIAADDALFGLPEVAVGIVNCEVPLANQAIPLCLLMEMSMTAEAIDANRALAHGMVNKVVPGEQLLEESMKMARTIAKQSPLAVRLSKENLLSAVAVTDEAKANEIRLYNLSSHSADAIEGFQAHTERRDPVWRS